MAVRSTETRLPASKPGSTRQPQAISRASASPLGGHSTLALGLPTDSAAPNRAANQ
jgi:hypothetical protein